MARAENRPVLTIDLSIDAEGWEPLETDVLIPRALHTAWAQAPGQTDSNAEVSILLTSDSEMRRLNGQYRGKDEPTNVLSFPADMPLTDGPVPLGDIVIALETLLREAADTGKPPGDHLSHLAIHGLLHLLGYDHENDHDAARMEGLETHILKTLDIPDPYADNESQQVKA